MTTPPDKNKESIIKNRKEVKKKRKKYESLPMSMPESLRAMGIAGFRISSL